MWTLPHSKLPFIRCRLMLILRPSRMIEKLLHNCQSAISPIKFLCSLMRILNFCCVIIISRQASNAIQFESKLLSEYRMFSLPLLRWEQNMGHRFMLSRHIIKNWALRCRFFVPRADFSLHDYQLRMSLKLRLSATTKSNDDDALRWTFESWGNAHSSVENGNEAGQSWRLHHLP